MIGHFGTISANPVPHLLSLSNSGRNLVVSVRWKLPASSIALDHSKIQKLRIEWSNTRELRWRHKELVIAGDDKRENQRAAGRVALINVGANGTYLFRVRHYYASKWSKMSNTKSIGIVGVSYEAWDADAHGAHVSVEGKVVSKRGSVGYETAFCCNVAAQGVHEWRFKVEGGRKTVVNKSGTRIFGVWRAGGGGGVESAAVLDTYFTDEKVVESHSDQAYSNPFGDKVKEGDVVGMALDLGALTPRSR